MIEPEKLQALMDNKKNMKGEKMKRTIALILSLIMLLSPTVMAYADAGTDAAALGFSYLRGNGVTQDYEKALEKFLEADWAGNTQVQFSVGEIYEYGHGVKKILSRQQNGI